MDDELDQLGARFDYLVQSEGQGFARNSFFVSRFGQIGHGLGDQFDLLGGHLDNLGQGLNRYPLIAIMWIGSAIL